MKKHSKGLSLLEVMFAIAVLGIALGGVLQMMSWGLLYGAANTNRLIADSLAREQVEWYFLDLTPIPFTGTTTEAYGTIPSYPSFRRVTTVSGPYLGFPTGDLVQITVDVFWDNNRSSRRFATLKGRY